MTNRIAVVQARMGSSRLTNKMLLHFHGYPIIHWVMHRVLQCTEINGVICAIPDNAENDVLHDYITGQGWPVFRGSEQDVLGRFVQAAEFMHADIVVRICADNPLICAEEVDRLVCFFANSAYDYAYNHIPKGNFYPDGLGAEISSLALLQEMNRSAHSASQREHVYNYLWDNNTNYNIATFNPEDKNLWHPEIKLDIDTATDYQQLMRRPLHIEMTAQELIPLFL